MAMPCIAERVRRKVSETNLSGVVDLTLIIRMVQPRVFELLLGTSYGRFRVELVVAKGSQDALNVPSRLRSSHVVPTSPRPAWIV